MGISLFRSILRATSLLKHSSSLPISRRPNSFLSYLLPSLVPNSSIPWWISRNLSFGTVNLVISQGKPKFETHEVDPPKKEKWKAKKRFKSQKMREKQKRKSANKRDPRKLGVKGNKKRQRFANAEERIKYKLDKARIKEALLIERLKRYEVAKVEGPVVKPHSLTGEERFYLKKMAQKGSNYVPVGRRGIFGGVILNMHLHWKKHETVKVICKPCKPGQVHEYANEIARLSGGIPVQTVGDDTIIFYRGKDYIQPEVMSPVDTLSKKRALEKSKYEQSLESVRRFIAIAEKELELYYRHVALYGDPNNRNPISILDHPTKGGKQPIEKQVREASDIASDDDSLLCLSETEADSTDQELSETEDFEDNDLVAGDSIIDYEDISGTDLDSDDEDRDKNVY